MSKQKTSETAIIDSTEANPSDSFSTPAASQSNEASTDRDSTQTLAPEELVGSYKIIKKLGAGGMGLVYEALDLDLNRKVALKLLRTENVKPEQVDRFLMEAKAAAAINHPNIIQVHSIGKHHGSPYFAMELVEGRDLSCILEDSSHPLTITEVIAILSGCVRALELAQELDIIHRDIKPANIMINQQGMVKVMDFGIAKASKLTNSITSEGQILGTPDYISPEQATGTGEVNFLADMYSLGCVAYQCLTGRLPFSADTPMEVICCHVLRAPEPIRNLNPVVPLELCSIVERMMAKEPENRYQSESELLAAVEGILSRLDSFDLPPNELLLDLAWHSQLTEDRAPRAVQSKPASSRKANPQVLVGRLMNLSGRETPRRPPSDRARSALELTQPTVEKFSTPRWGLPQLLSIGGILAASVLIFFLVTTSTPQQQQRKTFLYNPDPLTSFLPKGWKIYSVTKSEVTQSLTTDSEIEAGIYVLHYRGPQGRKVQSTVQWTEEGISPQPAQSMFAPERPATTPNVLPSKIDTTPTPIVAHGQTKWQESWSNGQAMGWSGGQIRSWHQRDHVLLSEVIGGAPNSLRFDTENGLPGNRPLEVTKNTQLKFELRVTGIIAIKIQLFSKSRSEVFVATAKTTADNWKTFNIPYTSFKSLNGKKTLKAGDSIEHLGLFPSVDPNDQSQQAKIGLATIQLSPAGNSKEIATR